MKRGVIVIIIAAIFCILSQLTLADEFLYDKESLDLDITISSIITGSAQSIILRQNDIPQTTASQIVTSQETNPTAEFINNAFVFEWNNVQSSVSYDITSTIKTSYFIPKIKEKIPYPTSYPSSLAEYTQPSAHIDSDNPAIKQQAQALAAGEDDLFVVLFKLASWVEENIEYELSTLTVDVSQPSSWVLQNRVGVCDEMTALFIAMARSLDIPARFVSGLSYTTAEEFDQNWLPHGWAEVYMGNQWVPFDPTFGELGFVDATHVKLSHRVDSKHAARSIFWEGSAVLQPEKIVFDVATSAVTDRPKDITMTNIVSAEKVNAGSYNLVTTHLENLRDYYIATTLFFANPLNIKLEQPDTMHLLLKPGEKKEVEWLMKVSDDLDTTTPHTFQVDVYNERNERASVLFRAANSGISYTKEAIRQLESAAQQNNSEITETIKNKFSERRQLSLGQRLLIFLKRLFGLG